LNRKFVVGVFRRKRILSAIVILSILIGIPLYHWRFDKWFIKVRMQASIGIYTARDPFRWQPAEGISNPVLTADDVTDFAAEIVADPFMTREGNAWYMFFEVANDKRAEIALATSEDGLRWTYRQVVIREPFVTSFPYVFKWRDEYYMILETHEANAVRLYKAHSFPTGWSFAGELLKGMYVDPAIVRHGDKWWLFAANVLGNDTLRLFYADDLAGPWVEHPRSPIVSGDDRIARPGGRVIVYENKVVRYPQDDSGFYGRAVRAFVIDELSTTEYREHEAEASPVLTGSAKWLTWRGWNAKGMHHIDPHQLGQDQWIACVDGFYKRHYVTWGPLRPWLNSVKQTFGFESP
jgi:hypothetical protein